MFNVGDIVCLNRKGFEEVTINKDSSMAGLFSVFNIATVIDTAPISMTIAGSSLTKEVCYTAIVNRKSSFLTKVGHVSNDIIPVPQTVLNDISIEIEEAENKDIWDDLPF